MLLSADIGRAQAVSRASLRHRASRSARGSRRTAVRRDRAGGTGALPRAEPVQRRPPDAAGVRGGGRAQLPRVARSRRSHPGGARVLGALAGLRRPGRRRAHPNGPRRIVAVEPYESGSVLPTSERIAGRRRGGCGSYGSHAPSSSRSSSSTKAMRRSTFPTARPTSRSKVLVSGDWRTTHSATRSPTAGS